MKYTFWDFLTIAGSIGLIFFGRRMMSTGLQKSFKKGLRKLINGMSFNPAVGVLNGALITGIVQSSSSVASMIASFVNAGLISLRQSMYILMGANIGIAFTVWIIALLGFYTGTAFNALVLIGIGLPCLLTRIKHLKYIGEVIIGLGILLIGLDFLRVSMPDPAVYPGIAGFFEQYTNSGFWSVLLFMLGGMILAGTLQSLVIIFSIIFVMAILRWIDFPIAAALILGHNIGTTLTVNLAARSGNIHARRVALFHTFFNITGTILVLLIFGLFLQIVDWSAQQFAGNSTSVFATDTDKTAQNRSLLIALALFHTVFNIITTAILALFIPSIERLLLNMKPKNTNDEKYKLQHMASLMPVTSEISITEAHKEILVMGHLVEKMMAQAEDMLNGADDAAGNRLEILKMSEDITDKMEIEIAQYLNKITESEISGDASRRIRNMINLTCEMERIGDVVYKIGKGLQGPNISITNKSIREIYADVKLSASLMNKHLDPKNEGEEFIKAVYQQEELINEKIQKIERKNLTEVEVAILSHLEKLTNHIAKANEAIEGLI